MFGGYALGLTLIGVATLRLVAVWQFERSKLCEKSCLLRDS